MIPLPGSGLDPVAPLGPVHLAVAEQQPIERGAEVVAKAITKPQNGGGLARSSGASMLCKFWKNSTKV